MNNPHVATIAMWTIYSHPSDYPLNFVVRRCIVNRYGVAHDAEPCALAPTLEAARAEVPEDCTNIGRNPADDPVIVEVWV